MNKYIYVLIKIEICCFAPNKSKRISQQARVNLFIPRKGAQVQLTILFGGNLVTGLSNSYFVSTN